MAQLININSTEFRRCNLSAIQSGGTWASIIPDENEIILISTANALTADGSGECDAYIIGDGATASAELELKKIDGGLKKEVERLTLEIDGGEFERSITPQDKKNGIYVVNTNTMLVYMQTSNDYYTTDPIDISSLAGSTIQLKASIVGSQGVFLCDSAMKAIDYVNGTNAAAKGYTPSSLPQVITFNNTEGAKYIVADIRNAYYHDIEDFKVTGSASIVGLKPRVAELETNQITDYIKKEIASSKNLFNPDEAEEGYISTAAGNIYVDSNYITSGYIPVKANEPITLSPKARKLLAFTMDKAPITSSYVNAIINNYTFTPTEDGFVRISFFSADSNIQVEKGTSVTSYEPYWQKEITEEGVHLSPTMEEDVEELIGGSTPNDNLRGKKWVHCGDSFSAYTNKNFESGTFAGKNKTYPRIIAERCGMTLNETFFLSGRTLAYPADETFTNSLTCPSAACYYQNIPADADYITIQLGINDLNHADGTGTTPDGEDATGVIELGTITDTITSTYYGAWNNVLTWLRNNRPFAHIGIIVTNGLGSGSTANGYHQAQIAIAKKYGIPYIDLNGDKETPVMNRFNNPDIDATLYSLLNTKFGINPPSDTHPNWQAHEYESTFIEAWLKSI